MLMFKYLLENFRHFIWRLALKSVVEQLLTQSRNLESLIVVVKPCEFSTTIYSWFSHKLLFGTPKMMSTIILT